MTRLITNSHYGFNVIEIIFVLFNKITLEHILTCTMFLENVMKNI